MQLTETVKVGHGGTHSTQLSIKISSKSATWFGALQFKIQPRSRKAGKHSEENNDNKFRKITYKMMSERTGLNSTKREIIEDTSLSIWKSQFWKDRNVPVSHIFYESLKRKWLNPQ